MHNKETYFHFLPYATKTFIQITLIEICVHDTTYIQHMVFKSIFKCEKRKEK